MPLTSEITGMTTKQADARLTDLLATTVKNSLDCEAVKMAQIALRRNDGMELYVAWAGEMADLLERKRDEFDDEDDFEVEIIEMLNAMEKGLAVSPR